MVLVALYFKHELIKLSHPLSLSLSLSLSLYRYISFAPIVFSGFQVSQQRKPKENQTTG